MLLAVLSLTLMTMDHRHQHVEQLRSLIAIAFFPVQYAADSPLRISHWTSEQLASRHRLITQNRELRADMTHLRVRQLNMDALAAENERLRQLLDSSARLEDRVLIARLMAVDLDPFRQQVVLNKGAGDDVYPGQPLINADGVVGQILEVHPTHSVALLISDPSHALPVEINRTGLRTLVIGTGHPERLELRFIPVSEDLEIGDIVSTSGLGGRFPADYPVARISQIERPLGSAFARVEAEPLARLDRSREVLLLWPGEALEPPIPAATDEDA
ncbi:rod shape-determining protein MreC [Ectothiorhodosinus mongolicus]|uniref:Cell shape-determining protein MreC n=1 Tax=Ectothiorhodosinus mongolicus TaxID=233100 RepID=A0A1R3VWV7_9GAMM|nr:rod shape-determining protein MreC [Ectothiorhodosinus mongolicus]